LKICERYHLLSSERQHALDLGRRISAISDPGLMPLDRDNPLLNPPHQGVNAACVHELSAKFTLAMFPPDIPFFRLQTELAANLPAEEKSQLESELARAELEISRYFESTNLRTLLGRANAQIIGAGPCVISLLDEGNFQLFELDQMVWFKRANGDIIEYILHAEEPYAAILEDYPQIVDEQNPLWENSRLWAETAQSRGVNLYTRVWLEAGKWHSVQEWELRDMGPEMAVEVPDSRQVHRTCPLIPFEFSAVDGVTYGHPYAHRFWGDMNYLEVVWKSLKQTTALVAQARLLVNPAGVTRKTALVSADNGAVVDGREEDISILSFSEKLGDFQWLAQVAATMENRLDRAFLRAQSVQRPGERVTAEEIRRLADDLERAFGGAYADAARRVQVPLVRRLIDLLVKAGRLPKNFLKLSVSIVTGIDALGRSAEIQRIQLAVMTLAQMGLGEVLAQRLNLPVLIRRVFMASGLADTDLVLTEEQFMEAQMAAQAQQAIPGLLQQQTQPNA
jgi:hypothetical protein